MPEDYVNNTIEIAPYYENYRIGAQYVIPVYMTEFGELNYVRV